MSFKLSHFDIFTELFDETKNRSGLPTIYVKEAIFKQTFVLYNSPVNTINHLIRN